MIDPGEPVSARDEADTGVNRRAARTGDGPVRGCCARILRTEPRWLNSRVRPGVALRTAQRHPGQLPQVRIVGPGPPGTV